MPLISLWESNATAVAEFTIEQVVATAGDGSLKDGSLCAQELQSYLAQIPSEKLAVYVTQCLSSKLENGGMSLQDLLNELGPRLAYTGTNGRYRGTVHSAGHEGIWPSPQVATSLPERRTTDPHCLSL